MLLRVASVTLLSLYVSRNALSFHFSPSPNSRHSHLSIIVKPQSNFAPKDVDEFKIPSRKTLFPCPRNKSYHRLEHFVSVSADDEPTRNKALVRRIYKNSIGRLLKLLLAVFVSMTYFTAQPIILFSSQYLTI